MLAALAAVLAACSSDDTPGPLVVPSGTGPASDGSSPFLTAYPSATPAPPESTPSAPPETPTPSPTVPASPTPTPPPERTPPPAPDAATAAEAYRNGDYGTAATYYRALAEAATGADRAALLFDLARALRADGKGDDTLAALDELDASGPDADTRLAALFMRAAAEYEAEDYPGAARDYVAYADQGGPAAIYARQDAASAYVQTGDEASARAQVQAALDAGPTERQRVELLLALAQGFDREGLWRESIDAYQAFFDATNSSGDAALALLRIGEDSRALGDSATWQQELLTVIREYPESSAAPIAIDSLHGGGVDPGPVLTGTVYYKNFRDHEALGVLRPYLSDPALAPGPEAAQGAYYYATSLERLGRIPAAIRWYDRAYAFDTTGPFADRALWWAAFNADSTGDYPGAADRYRRLLDAFPSSSFAPEAGFRIALTYFRRQDLATAARLWQSGADAATGEARSRDLLWAGKALDELGDDAGVRAAWAAAYGDGDWNYYALRAEALLAGVPSAPLDDPFAPLSAAVEPDWPAIKQWVTELAGPKPAGVPTPTHSAQWSRALALRRLGEERRAGYELESLVLQYQSQPWPLLALVRGLYAERVTSLAARGSALLYGQAPAGLQASAPQDLYRISFPLDWLPIVAKYTGEYGAPPLLLYALVRQESFFDPNVVSSADAIGLGQVVPSTGEGIAAQLGMKHFTADLLYRPRISLRFASYYLGSQLKEFDDNAYFVLTAYNAGPGNASRLSDGGTASDMDLYVEDIDLEETNLYVRIVLQNYARYRWLYLGLDHPSLLPASYVRAP